MYKFESELAMDLVNAQINIPVGDFYRHYKNQEIYRVVGHYILKEEGEIGIAYKAQYGEELPWITSILKWTEMVEVNGRQVPRFQKVYPNEQSGLV